MADWREVARKFQQQYLEISESGDWDVRRSETKSRLSAKVRLVIYGARPLTRSQEENVKRVTDAIVRLSDGGCALWATLVVVVVKPGSSLYSHPVFRVGNSSFVDCIGRVYSSWSDFERSNKLPEGETCFPRGGVYRREAGAASGRVQLDFGRRKTSSDLVTALDTVDAVFKVFSLGVAAAKAWECDVDPNLEKVDSVGSVISDVYGAARALSDQLDRDAHGQSEGSLNNWASIAERATAVGRSGGSGGVVARPSKQDVAFRAVNLAQGLFTATDETPPEMLRDIRDDLDLIRGGGGDGPATHWKMIMERQDDDGDDYW